MVALIDLVTVYVRLLSGSYCEASTEASPKLIPTPCPIGTYGNSQGLTQESECETCDEGSYCATEGQHYLSFLLHLLLVVN